MKSPQAKAAANKPVPRDSDSEDDDNEHNNQDHKGEKQQDNNNRKESEKQQQEQEDEQQQPEVETNNVGVITTATFASLGVCSTLCEATTSLGWKFATKIQEQVLPHALSGRDVIGLAETGSGKTGAFCIPMLQNLLQKNVTKGAVFGIILTPTRELAFQIHEVLEGLGCHIGATSVCIVGGVDSMSQSIALARNPHIIVATPGRLVDHLQNTKGFHLRQLQFLVLDEADRMLSLDFEEALNQIFEVIPMEGRQTLLFSATMTNKVQKLQRASLSNPIKVEVSTKFQTPSTLLQSYLFIPAKYKDCYFTYLINEHAGKSILVFGATCQNVQRLALMLRNLGFPAICLHGQMSQPKRLGALHQFQSKAKSILLCTDVASRGLDIPNVDLVVNYDLPGHGKEYIHRVGRTARAGLPGTAIAMVTQYDVEVYQRLEHLLGKKLPEYKLTEETVLILLERVNEAQRLATRELKEQMQQANAGRRHRKRRNDEDGNDNDGDDNNVEALVKKELRKGYYAGGSGGNGGALPNQSGSGKNRKKYKHGKR